jgi:signal transduction histidine kinase
MSSTRRFPEAPPELYRSYRREVEGWRMARSARSGAAIVAALNTGFIPLDWLAFRADFAGMLAARLACNAVMAAVFFGGAERWPLRAAAAGCLAVGGMLLHVIAVAGGPTGEYSPGLMLLFLGMPVLLPFSARQAAGIVALLLAGLAGLPLLAAEAPPLRAYLFHLTFPAAAGVESVLACALLDRLRFVDFQRRRALERLDEEKSRFTANVHHELRTPLTLVLAPLEAMLAGDFGPVAEPQRGYLATMHANALRLLELINNLLDLAKIESGQLRIARRRVRLGGRVLELVAGAKPLAARKGVALRARGLEELPEICIDPNALEKVIVNLLGNALKFTDAGGWIEVSGAATAAGGLRLAVEDTGCGIPAEDLERIFDRFAQVDASSTRRYEGTGIGLSLVRELVELHGGRVWAESPGPGRGTRMQLELPAGAPDAEPAEAALEPEARPPAEAEAEAGRHAPAGGSGFAAIESELALGGEGPDEARLVELRHHVERAAAAAAAAEAPHGADAAPEVLVCEDNPDMRRLLAELLAREFRVRLAANGREGLERARAAAPSVVVTDVMMPEMSGTELCRALKGDPATAGIPVVLVTSKAEREMKIQGLELGADDYVTKPFHPRELLARVRALARLRRLQEEAEVRSQLLERANAELARALDELREAGVRLVQSERLAAVGELAAGIAHEANNPINFAANALRELTRRLEDLRAFAGRLAGVDWRDAAAARAAAPKLAELQAELGLDELADSVAELVGIAGEGLERTRRLVGDLRDFAAPAPAPRAPCDLRRGLASTAQLLSHAFRDARVELRLDLDPGLPSVEGDPRALNQVFLNLLKNAAEALEGRGGTVWVSARAEGDAVRVEVRDDGPGIAPEALARIFEPFHTTKPAGRGSGLGLSISRRIVAEHGGSLEVESRPGAGATFAVRLPLRGGAVAA